MPQAIGLFAPQGSVLGAAVAAALAVRGWAVDVMSDLALLERSRMPRMVVVLDGQEAPSSRLDGAIANGGAKQWICLGSLEPARRLAALARLGVVILNQEVPFLMLLSRLEHLLAGLGTIPPRNDLARTIERRAADATKLSALTQREHAVLCQLMRGMTVAEIARDGRRTTHTIRSQVQGVLRRLGVSSQVEAVAIGHRSGATAFQSCLDSLHQFW